jgi:dTDP-4-dehydrorhamnose reductase
MNKKILILGADGLLGSDLSNYFSEHAKNLVFGVSRSQLDITDYQAVTNKLNSIKPDFVINCAAYTNVDKAVFEKDKCRLVNVEGAYNVAKVVSQQGSELIHISTASVFNSYSNNPINSNSDYSPANFYSQTKAEAEQVCQETFGPNGLLTIMRTYWLYGSSKPNFCSFLANNLIADHLTSVALDQNGQPTSTKTVFESILHRIENRVPSGIYPATNSGHASRIEWAEAIAKLLCKPTDLIQSVDPNYFASPAERPFNASLDHSEWNRYGIYIDDWKMALGEFLEKSFNRD